MKRKLLEKKEGNNLGKIIKKNQVVILTLALMLMTAGYMNYTNNHENENELLAQLGDAQLVSANVTENTNETQDMKNSNDTANKNDVQNSNQNQSQNEIVNKDEIQSSNQNQNETQISNEIENKNRTEDINNELVETSSNSVANEQQVNNGTNNQVSMQTSTTDDYFTKSKLEREAMYSQMLETYNSILENEKISSDQKGIAENEIKNINDRKNAIMIVENLLQTKDFKNSIVFINEPSVNVVIKAKELSTEQVAQIQNIVQRELEIQIENIHITTKE